MVTELLRGVEVRIGYGARLPLEEMVEDKEVLHVKMCA